MVGQFLWDVDGNHYLFVTIDLFSKWVETYTVRFCCLFVAVCSAVAAGCVCMYCACCTYLQCVWDRLTNKVRTVDRVRVNGW